MLCLGMGSVWGGQGEASLCHTCTGSHWKFCPLTSVCSSPYTSVVCNTAYIETPDACSHGRELDPTPDPAPDPSCPRERVCGSGAALCCDANDECIDTQAHICKRGPWTSLWTGLLIFALMAVVFTPFIWINRVCLLYCCCTFWGCCCCWPCTVAFWILKCTKPWENNQETATMRRGESFNFNLMVGQQQFHLQHQSPPLVGHQKTDSEKVSEEEVEKLV